MSLLRIVDRATTLLVTTCLVVAFAVMLGLAVVQLFLRSVFHGGSLWGDIAARHLVIWVGFFGAYLATHENKHFRIDILTRFLSQGLRLWFNAFSDLFAAVVCSLLFRASLTFVYVGMDPESIVFLRIPQQVVAYIVPVGFALITVQFLIRMIVSISDALKGNSSPGSAAEGKA